MLLRVARRLRQLPPERLDHLVDLRVELRGRDGPVDEPPLRGLRRRDLLTHQHDLAGAPVADHDRQPLRRAAGRHRAVLRSDVPDERVVHHHREVARHLQLVAAADRDPVDPRHRRLADLAQPVVHVLEGAEPLPVLGRVAEVAVRPLAQVRADAEGAPRPRHDHDADRVVPRRVLTGTSDLAEHLEVEGVQDLGPVEGDRRPRRRLLVDDPLEAELVGGDGAWSLGLAHAISAKWTWKRPPISIASLPVAMNSSVRAAARNASWSANSHSASYGERRSPGAAPITAPTPQT